MEKVGRTWVLARFRRIETRRSPPALARTGSREAKSELEGTDCFRTSVSFLGDTNGELTSWV